MRNFDRPEPLQPLGELVRRSPPSPVQTLRQVPGARPGVVSDGSGAFRTVPQCEVPK